MAATVPMSNNNVQFSTYLSWKLGDSFDVDVVEIESRRIVNKICSDEDAKDTDQSDSSDDFGADDTEMAESDIMPPTDSDND